MRKIIAAALSVLMMFACTACTGGDKGGENGAVNQTGGFKLWGAPATEKVLQDKVDLEIYDVYKTDAKINVLAARGEYESAQIIITAERDLNYDVAVSGLTSGTNVFPASAVEVFHEKYVSINENFENNGMPVGMYPDALLPFSVIKERKENNVKKGENQGIYFRFNVGLTQEAGVYTGEYTITVGGEARKIPVTLDIADLTVSEESHVKSLFCNSYYASLGETDTSQDMADKYTEALFSYRLNPHIIAKDNSHSDADILYFTEKAYQFMQNPKCTNISMPYGTISVNNPHTADTTDKEYCIDPIVFDKYLTAYAMKSFDTGFNMFKKTILYFLDLIDEPLHNNVHDRVKIICDAFEKQKTETANRLQNDASVTAANKAEIIASLRNIQNLVTSAYYPDYADRISTWCPQIIEYNDEIGRQVYDSQEDKWWYTSVSVRAPYPTYHIEDTLLSARTMGWMQAEYNTGNLFWAADYYVDYIQGVGARPLEDYYNGSAERYPKANGDGFLFYPGKPYGIDGPVGTMRLEAIRDGLEEYEILYAMKQTYAEISGLTGGNFNSNAVIKNFSGLIYNGTKVSATNEKFYSARKSLFELASLSEGDSKFCIADYVDDGYGTKTYQFYTAGGAVIKNDGQEITDVRDVAGGKLYTLALKMDKPANELNLTVEADGKTLVYTQMLGGRATVNRAGDTTAAEFSKEGVTPAYTLVDASTVIAGATGSYAKIDLPAAPANTSQNFRVNGALIKGLNKTTDKYVLHIYYGGTGEIPFNITAKHEKHTVYYELINTTLKPGLNAVTVSMFGKNWDNLGDIEFIVVRTGARSAVDPARTVYLMDTVLYAK